MDDIKYSFGIGDRFGMQGLAQLKAFKRCEECGVIVVPVWNKSHREHTLTGTSPGDVRTEADEAAKALGWKHPYHIDADHITMKTADAFLESSDFFTIDVADRINTASGEEQMQDFITRNEKFTGTLPVPGMNTPVKVTGTFLEETARKFLNATEEAGRIYKKITDGRKGKDFLAEVSMDETDRPQSPGELFFILGELAHRGVRINSIAPKFTGSFHKGVDYSGDPQAFAREFEQDLIILEFAREEFGLPHNLKISVHSGSDKFSIYPAIRKLIRKHHSGLHLKTAGTTWLEELTGLIQTGGPGLTFARNLYAESLIRKDELLAPYRSVTDIDFKKLPSQATVNSWEGEPFARAVRHDPSDSVFNPDLRQFLHLSYKLAAERMKEFRELVMARSEVIEARVTDNLFLRHMKPLFIDPV